MKVCRRNSVENLAMYDDGTSEKYFSREERRRRLQITTALFWRAGIY